MCSILSVVALDALAPQQVMEASNVGFDLYILYYLSASNFEVVDALQSLLLVKLKVGLDFEALVFSVSLLSLSCLIQNKSLDCRSR